MKESSLGQYYEQAAEWIDSKSSRERVFIGLSILALVFLVWTLLIQSGYDSREKELKSQLAALQADQKLTQEQLTAITTSLATGPAKVKQSEINQLNSQLQQIQTRLSEVGQGLIAAEQLPEVLRSVFEQTRGLELINVQTLAAKEMMIASLQQIEVAQPNVAEPNDSVIPGVPNLQATQNTQPAPKPQGSGVFKHGVVLKLRGDFFRILALVKSLENLPWKFYWESLDYSVKQYPQAEIELRVFTLSSEEGLLGV
jgi:MSHA biogenesis protein MshJ